MSTTTSHSLVKNLHQIPSSVWGLGFSNMLINLSTVMVFSTVTLYMTERFGATPEIIGQWDGILQAIALISRIFSGMLSDFFRSRKGPLLIGYLCAACSRPIMALAGSLPFFMTAHVLDRLANGIQAAPREALVGDVTPRHLQGECYGLRYTLAVAGSIIGPVIAWRYLKETDQDFTGLFQWALLPAILGIVALLFMVHDAPIATETRAVKKHLPTWSDIKKLSLLFWVVIALNAFFTLARFGEAFLMLQAKELGLSSENIPLVMLVMNVFTFLAAFPFGALSDRYDRRVVLGIGFGVLIVADLALGMSGYLPTGAIELPWIGVTHMGLLAAFFGIAFWGAQLGATKTIFDTMVSETSKHDLRATAFGIYYLTSGLVHIVAGYWSGHVWKLISPSATYLIGGGITLVALCIVPFLPPFTGHKTNR